jgi:UDP-glucose 4-epimerase
MERVIPLFVHRIYHGLPIKIYGRKKVLDFTYVDDCVAGLIAGIDALLEGRVVNQTFNLAYGQGQTLSDLVTLIEMATGRKAEATFEEPRPGEVTRYIADIKKATDLLGYRPQTPLIAGIGKYVEWLRGTDWLDSTP